MQCISTPSFTVKIGQTFRPERGIRQGDPISPYIFIIRAEYLKRYIHYTLKNSDIGFKLNKDCPNNLYLKFIDDCIIFCKATKVASRNVRNILYHYYKVLG